MIAGSLFEWTRFIKERDGRCIDCGSLEELHAHHIKAKKQYPDLSLETDNGETLCFICHRKRHPDLGRLVSAASRRGLPKSEEHRRKISTARMGHPVSGATRAKLSAIQKAVSHVGRPHSPESKKHMSEARKGWAQKPAGWHHTDTTKEKMREIRKRRPRYAGGGKCPLS